ncbi:response regulator [Anaerolentibacter hominis]|uniref:response regulator n=1 Tax=Anaerolentibacter hominis TaxID=3079009 RepID=UPI0031B839F2
MRTIIVDDELLSMEQFELESAGIPDIELVGKFDDSFEALEYAREHQIDFALLDIEMPEMNGLILGQKLRELYPDVVLVYVTGYEEYMMEALKQKADYYVMKPYDHNDIVDVLERARLLSRRQRRRIYVRTFGRFDVFADGEAIHFSSAKAKELLALCVDHRGGFVSMEEAIDKLWSDRMADENTKTAYRKAVMYLHKLFQDRGFPKVFISQRGKCSINRSEIVCDYYDYLDRKENAPEFHGEYLFDYDWAEETTAQLCGMYDLDCE